MKLLGLDKNFRFRKRERKALNNPYSYLQVELSCRGHFKLRFKLKFVKIGPVEAEILLFKVDEVSCAQQIHVHLN